MDKTFANKTVLGFSVVVSECMVQDVETTRDRTWKERWLSLPWRPWIKTETVTQTVPADYVIIDKVRRIVYCHPSMVDQIDKKIASSKG